MAVKTPPVPTGTLPPAGESESPSLVPLPDAEIDAIEDVLSPTSDSHLDLDSLMATKSTPLSSPKGTTIELNPVETGAPAAPGVEERTEAEIPSGNGKSSSEGTTPSVSRTTTLRSSTRGKDKETNVQSRDVSRQSSQLSSAPSDNDIPELPTDLTTSPVKSGAYRTRGSDAAESSAQALERLRTEPKIPKLPKGPKVTKASKVANAPRTTKSIKEKLVTPKVVKSIKVTAILAKGKAKAKEAVSAKSKKQVDAGTEKEVEPSVESRSRKRPLTNYNEDSEEDEGDVEDEWKDELRSIDEEEKAEQAKVIEKAVKKTIEKKSAKKAKIRSEKSRKRAKVISDVDLQAMFVGKDYELQALRCVRTRYADWGKCAICSSKVAGDSCRFEGYRSFPVDPKTGDICGPGYFADTVMTETPTALPFEFSTPLTEEHLLRVEHTAAPMLLPIITRELRHIVKNKAIKRMIDPAEDRSYCDFCSCTIFAGYFFCKTCGRDYCLTCERYFSDEYETMNKSPWHVLDAARPRLLKCLPVASIKSEGGSTSTTRNREPQWHFRNQLQPVSSLSEGELRAHWLALAEYGVKGDSEKPDWATLFGYSEEDAAKFEEDIEKVRIQFKPITDSIDPTLQDPPIDSQGYYTKLTHPVLPLPADPAGLRKESLPFIKIGMDTLNNENFDQLWAKGEPIVVEGIAKKFQKMWTPKEMVSNFGSDFCDITDCEKDVTWKSTLEEFFQAFKNKKRDSEDIWKLGDWPTGEKFQIRSPGLYDDFCQALPVPDYTMQNGSMNMYSHFPPGPTKPDIGPKMYNAFGAREDKGGHGSTRMHMDIADAINIMLYAANPTSGTAADIEDSESTLEIDPTLEVDNADTASSSSRPNLRNKPRQPSPRSAPNPPQSQTGCAVWDIYRAEDTDKIRLFLKKKFQKHKTAFTDPIHSQMFYLDASLRKELWEKMGVASFRIYQYPGQAVFIPAGCAHQVCNLADCIKIAMDFVSPHNVTRCQQLTQDFRKENFIKVWKDDVLQLYNILWFAWLSARDTRTRREKEDIAQATRLADLDNSRTSLSRQMTSSIRDDHSTLPTTPPTNQNIDSLKDLVNRLLESALSAPDPEPPEDAKPPPEQKGSKWGRAPIPKPQPVYATGSSSKKTRSSKGRQEVDEDDDDLPKPSGMTVGGMRNLVTYGKRGQRARKVFEDGLIPMDLSLEVVRHGLGQGSVEE